MPAPTVPYKVMSKGFQITGDLKGGYKAVVPYLVTWGNAYRFADDVFGLAYAGQVGPITWYTPWRYPYADANLYASSFTIDPCGNDGLPIPASAGLRPGDVFTHAIIKLTFATPSQTQSGRQDDPNKLHQLDPKNPLTMCEQSVKIGGKMQTKHSGSFLFPGGTPLKGDTGVLVCEAKLELTFPRVPYLPWALVRPYIGTLNDIPILDCDRGSLLLEGMDTKVVQTNLGITQQVQLSFAWSSKGDWNLVDQPNGIPALVYRKGGSNTDANRIYTYANHYQIFNSLNYG